jgi:uncharacterized membrane protein
MNPSEPAKKFFSISEAIEEGWRLTRSHLGNILLLEIVGLLIFVVISLLSGTFIAPLHAFGAALNTVIQWLLSAFLGVAAIQIALKIVDGKEFGIEDLFNKQGIVLNYFGAFLLSNLAFILGLICFIIPGLIIGIRFGFFGFFVVDKFASSTEALKLSWELIKGCSWRMFFFQVSIVLINLMGILCFGIGLLITLPVTVLAATTVYRKLLLQTFKNETNTLS